MTTADTITVLQSLEEVSSAALTRTRAIGIPDALFVGLCELLEADPVDSVFLTGRYSPNTRARALQICIGLARSRDEGWLER